jgi:hypothetical protein
MGTRMPKINIPESELPRIEWLAELTDDDFEKLIKVLGETQPKVKLGQFSKEVSKRLEFIPSDKLSEFLTTIFAIHRLKERYRTSTKEFATSLGESARSQLAEKNTLVDAVKLSSRFDLLFNLVSVGVTAKALDVLREHERVFCDARILTDMRPVFLDDGNSSPAAMIVHQLQLSFHKGEDHTEMYFALDAGDLENLIVVIERAKRKPKVLEKVIADAKLTHLET